MARDVESLVLQMSADLRRFEKSMASMDATARKRLTAVEAQALKSQKNLERTMGRAGDGMVAALRSSLSAIAPTLAAAFSAAAVIKYADSYTSLQNRLKAAGLQGRELQRVEDALYETANRNGLQVSATAELYSRASLSRQRLGASEQQLLQLVSGTAAALKVQGTSAEAASGPLLQLGQALSGTKVQAEEYNSLIDGLPVLLQAAAKGSTRFGGDVAKLTEQVKAGKVTSQEFFQALLAGFPAIEAQAGASTTTVSSALQTLDNQLGRYIGQSDSSLSATQRAAQGIIGLANNLDVIIPIVGVLATVVGGRYVLALTAATGAQIANGVSAVRLALFQNAMSASMTGTSRAALLATASTRTFSAALAANPIGAVLVAVTALAAGLIYLNNTFSQSAVAQRELSDITEKGEDVLGRYEKAQQDAKVATGENAKAARDHAAALREEAGEIIAVARLNSQKRLTEAAAARSAATTASQQSNIAQSRGQTPGRFNSDVAAGRNAEAVTRQTEANAATERYNTALKEQLDLEAQVNNINNGRPRNGGGGGPLAATAVSPGGPKGGGGASATDLAAQRQMLDLQAQVELLRAQGQDKAAKAIQRQIDTLTLTKQYEDAGFQNAKAKAEAQVAALAKAETSAEFIAQFEKDQDRFIEDQTAKRERQSALAEDELGFRVEIARLLGDEAGVIAAQREYDIARRTADLQTKGLSETDARNQAAGESDKLRGAEIVGGLGDGFVDPIEQMRDVYAEIDRLRQEDVLSEQDAAAAKAQANAIYQEQRLSSASSFFGTLAELSTSSNKTLAAIGKAAAITQATMDGYVAVQKALASAPPPFNYIAAAAVGIVAAANVAKIAGFEKGGYTGNGGKSDVAGVVHGREYVFDAAATSRIGVANLEALRKSGGLRMPNIPSAAALPSSTSNSLTYSPTIDARGSDMAAVARLERLMVDERRQFSARVLGTVGKRARYRLGQNVDA